MSLFSHPIKKLTLLAAFGGGYVLGAKAGRERYEQIKHTAARVKDDPRVQQATVQAQEFARQAAERVKDEPRVRDVVDTIEHHVDDLTQHDLTQHDLDETVTVEDPVVYSVGPDIEESIDELTGPDAVEQEFTGDTPTIPGR